MQSVNASLLYANPPTDGTKAYNRINADTSLEALLGPINFSDRNYSFTPQTKLIVQVDEDAKRHHLKLDTAGFQFHTHPSQEMVFSDDEAKLAKYYTESIELIEKLTGATRVVIFDHTIRRNRPGDSGNDPKNRHPVPTVHVDQTPESAAARVSRHLGADADSLLKKRYQIINLWRPIHHTAYDWPLALCDYRTVDAERDLVRATLKYPDREGETFLVRHNSKHQWYYAKGMTPDEVVLIKCFDSVSERGVARFTPHSAFEDSSTPPDAPLRQSIELRALVFYE